ncbi:MAG: MAPEG family protein [Alphaproteobacteria bacterium]
MTAIVTPMLALVVWTLVMWLWMYIRRIPALQAAGIAPDEARHPGSLDLLPSDVRAAADNYNHLHEQPTLFYAIVVYSHLTGLDSALAVGLAWTYVALRIVHSLIQITINRVLLRFLVFAAASVVLIVLTALNVLALM